MYDRNITFNNKNEVEELKKKIKELEVTLKELQAKIDRK